MTPPEGGFCFLIKQYCFNSREYFVHNELRYGFFKTHFSDAPV